jgi:hypothetical protein
MSLLLYTEVKSAKASGLSFSFWHAVDVKILAPEVGSS